MDDTQDKVRRNVVVVAAAVILIQSLQIEISPSTTHVSIFTISKVSQLQFWILTLVVLGYLFQRYWFDSTTKAQKEHAWTEFYGFRDVKILEKLQRELRNYVMSGEKPKSINGYSDVVRRFQSANYPPDTFDAIHVGLLRNPDDKPWQKASRMNIELTRTKGGHPVSTEMSDWQSSYRLSYGDMLKVSVGPVLRTALFSKSSVDFLVPLYLAVGALIVCLFRLWEAVANA